MPTLDGKDVKIVVADTCTACGLCVGVCPCEYLQIKDRRAGERMDPAMGCITCGQCAAICPCSAIHVQAALIGPEDMLPFPTEKPASYDQLMSLLARRRSIRRFTGMPVGADIVKKILEAAQQAPVGIPPSTVQVLAINGQEKVRAFAFDFLDEAARMAWLFSRIGIWALRPMMSAAQHKDMRDKVVPIYQGLLAGRRQGKDFLFYDAPLAMVFTGQSDPVDPLIAATYAMAAAQSLGLGSCMIGSVTPMLPATGKIFQRKYGIKPGRKDGVAIIFGYFDTKFQRGIRRRFEDIVWK